MVKDKDKADTSGASIKIRTWKTRREGKGMGLRNTALRKRNEKNLNPGDLRVFGKPGKRNRRDLNRGSLVFKQGWGWGGMMYNHTFVFL